jgi:hypothetical protein
MCGRDGEVRFGSKGDVTALKCDFRYTPENGLKSDISRGPKSAKNELWSVGDLQRQKPHIAAERWTWLDAAIRELLQLATQLMNLIGLA